MHSLNNYNHESISAAATASKWPTPQLPKKSRILLPFEASLTTHRKQQPAAPSNIKFSRLSKKQIDEEETFVSLPPLVVFTLHSLLRFNAKSVSCCSTQMKLNISYFLLIPLFDLNIKVIKHCL